MEFPNFRLLDDGQIQKQRSENLNDLIIQWKVVTKMLGAVLGHGVQFLYPGDKGILIAFIDGFGWLHQTEKHVNVFILSIRSELWGSYTDNFQKIFRTLKECVHLVLKGKTEACEGIVKDNISCFFNA